MEMIRDRCRANLTVEELKGFVGICGVGGAGLPRRVPNPTQRLAVMAARAAARTESTSWAPGSEGRRPRRNDQYSNLISQRAMRRVRLRRWAAL